MPTLRNVLKETKRELEKKEEARESSQKSMRRATSLSKHAIFMIHQKKVPEARRLIEDAKKIILELYKVSESYPEIIYCGLFSAALQEYSEANIFLGLVEKSEIVTPKEINVSSVDYILGLADVIGEYRRRALDALRVGNTKKGEECLQTMDEIYIELMAMDEAYMMVSGLRRKCDVARKIIEATRGDITQEIGRNALEKRLKSLEKLIGKSRA